MLSTFLAICLYTTAPAPAVVSQRRATFVQTSPTDCEVFSSVLRAFTKEAAEAGKDSGYLTLRYVVSDRSHVLPEDLEEMLFNQNFGPTDHIREVLHQAVFRNLRERAAARSTVTCHFFTGFSVQPDGLLPANILVGDVRFQRRFKPAEGVIYFTLPGYTDDYNGALVVTEMYFSLWETATLYFVHRARNGDWNVVWRRGLREQGE